MSFLDGSVGSLRLPPIPRALGYLLFSFFVDAFSPHSLLLSAPFRGLLTNKKSTTTFVGPIMLPVTSIRLNSAVWFCLRAKIQKYTESEPHQKYKISQALHCGAVPFSSVSVEQQLVSTFRFWH